MSPQSVFSRFSTALKSNSTRTVAIVSAVITLVLASGLGYWWGFYRDRPQPFSDPYVCRFMATQEVETALNHSVAGNRVLRESPMMECNLYMKGMPSLIVIDTPRPNAVSVGGYGRISLASLPSRPTERPSDTVYEVDTGVSDSSAYLALRPESRYPAFAVWFSPGTNHTVLVIQEYDHNYIGQEYNKELEALIVHVARAFDHAYRTGETPQPQPTD